MESNESGASNNHAVEQMRKDMEQQIIELTGRLKLKDEVNFNFFLKDVFLDSFGWLFFSLASIRLNDFFVLFLVPFQIDFQSALLLRKREGHSVAIFR